MSEEPASAPLRRHRGGPNTALTFLIGLPIFVAVTGGTVWLLQSVGSLDEEPAEVPPPTAQQPDEPATDVPLPSPEAYTAPAQPVEPIIVDRSDEVFAPIKTLPSIVRDPETAPSYSQIVADQRLWPEVLALIEPHTIPIRGVGREMGRITLEEGTVLQVVKILQHGYMMVRADQNQFVVPVYKTNLDFIPDPQSDAAQEVSGAAIERSRLQDHAAVLLANPDAPNADELRERLARNAIMEHVTQITRDWGRNALGVAYLELDGGLLTARLRPSAYEDSPDLTFAARQIARRFVEEAQSWGANLNFMLCKVETADGESTVATGSFRGAYVEAAQVP